MPDGPALDPERGKSAFKGARLRRAGIESAFLNPPKMIARTYRTVAAAGRTGRGQNRQASATCRLAGPVYI